MHATCLVDGLAVLLTARTSDRNLIDLLNLAVLRLGSIDRAAFGFSSDPNAPSSPPECVEARPIGEYAPIHCEDTEA